MHSEIQEMKVKDYIPIITKKYSCKINTDDILYIEQQQRKLTLVTEQGSYSFYERMDNIIGFLDDRFFRTMKHLTVNLEKILMAREQRIVFQNGETIYLGKENYIRTKQRYVAYLRRLTPAHSDEHSRGQ